MRGDTVDNIPGAPGIGDKGSVDLIQRFGSVEAALDRAAEVERKTYRESLQNNRDMVLLSKQLVTIDCNVAVDFEPDKMLAQAPDAEAARALFTELEFNTLTKEFIYRERGTRRDRISRSRVSDQMSKLCWPRCARFPAACWPSRWRVLANSSPKAPKREIDEEPDRQMMLSAAAEKTAEPSHLRLAISAKQGAHSRSGWMTRRQAKP